MQKTKALWLCSWFPDKIQEQNGDFVERQAIATALYADVDVFHIAPAPYRLLNGKRLEKAVVEKTPNLHYYSLLYAKKNESLYNKAVSVFCYFSNYKKELKAHFAKNGLPDIVHVHIAFKDGIVALWLKRKYGIPFILTEHSTIYLANEGTMFRKKNFLHRYFVKKILRNASQVLPVSQQLADALQSIEPKTTYQIVPNVVDTSLFQTLPRNERNNTFTFIHISDGSEKKNLEGILASFVEFDKQVPNTRLHIVGIDLNKPFIKEYSNYKNIVFTPNVPYAEVAQLLAQSHAAIVNSTYETFSCIIIESLSCGVPVISTNVGVAPDIIQNHNGILIEKNKTSLLAAMLDMYHNYQKYLENQDPIYIQAQYNYKKIGADINDIYSNLLKK